MPIPRTAEELARFEQIRRESAHRSNNPDVSWNLEVAELWPGVLKDFHHQVLAGGHRLVLQMPPDTKAQQRWMRALCKLTRVAIRNGNASDLAGLWQALIGVTSESGEEELLDDGVMHPDILRLSLNWSYLRLLFKEKVGWDPEPSISAYAELNLALSIHETVVRDGLVFLTCLLKAANRQPANFWGDLLELRGREARVRYYNQVLVPAVEALGDLTKRKGITKRDKAALKDMLTTLQRSGVWNKDRPNLTVLRDIIAHGKYSVDHQGTTLLDSYEHWIVNKFGLTTPGRIGYRTHHYKYRSISAKGANSMLSMANSLAVVFWAAYQEFNRGTVATIDPSQPTPPAVEVVQAAATNLIVVDPKTKKGQVTKERKRIAKMRKQFKVKFTRVKTA